MKTAIVAGAVANKYLNGGAVWTRLNWALGMKKLGFRVYFLEQIDRQSCVDENGHPVAFECSANLEYFRTVMREFGLDGTSALILEDGSKVDGLSPKELQEVIGCADILINITGHLKLSQLKKTRARRLYIDLDPGYTQIWREAGLMDRQFENHDQYFTVGEAIGSPGCPIPTGEITWNPIRQPVVLERWPVSGLGEADRFTTVAAWRDSYGPLNFQGQTLGLKVHEFRKFICLPELIPQRCEIALDIHAEDEKDLDLLQRHGWVVENPRRLAPDPAGFRDYVQHSGAEFSVAKQVYVVSKSGWFSDRTVRYLASGKPALVQDTGFSDIYPVGEGLLAFRNIDEAIEGAGRIHRDYEHHCRAARKMAEEWFDSDRVLGAMVERAGVLP